MSSPTKHHLLKVFSGPHLGAEVLLGDGEFVIGSDDSCDVIFGDQFIAPKHAKIFVDGESIECSALDGARVFIEGQEATTARLAPFQYFTLGNTHLALGPADTRWPVIDFPEFQLQSVGAANVDLTDDGDGREEHGRDEENDSNDQELAKNTVASDEVDVAAENREDDRTWKIIAAALIAFCACLLILGLILLITPGGQDRNEAIDVAAIRSALEDVIQRHEYSQTVKVVEKSNRLTVEGHVSNKETRDILKGALRDVDPSIRVRLWNTDGLVEQARDVARMHNAQIDVSPGKPGEVIIQGELPDMPTKTKLARRISEDVPRIATLTDLLTIKEDAKSETAAVIVQANPSEQQVASNRNVGVAGIVVLPGLPPIQSLNVGNTRSITLSDGQRIYRGALLENGYTIAQIEKNRVVLSRGEKQQIVKIGL